MASIGLYVRSAALSISVTLIPFVALGQVAGKNINMVSGTQWPGGDPHLQRQNEGSQAPSTRNWMTQMGGANDYRTVDLPGLPNGGEIGDAWLGVFKSKDGGQTWTSTLVPGYPQDTSPEGMAAPIRGFPAAADPMVRSGLFGMFYYSGIALTRSANPVSAVFVARYNDLNNREGADSIQYIGMSTVFDGRPTGEFGDKPGLAVDLPRPGALMCSVAGQNFPGGNVYVAYSTIAGTGPNTTAKIWFSRSRNCGATWSTPMLLSGNHTVNQGSAIAVDTWSGAVYVAWRRFKRGSETDAILIAKSVNGGQSFSAPQVISTIIPFEQGTTEVSFRTNAYPAIVTDASGRVYVAWSDRSGPTGNLPDVTKGEARVVLTSSPNGTSWSSPVMVAPLSGRGHQFMPALSFTSGKLMLIYYDLRDDSTIGHFALSGHLFIETRVSVGDRANPAPGPDKVFTNFVMETVPLPLSGQLLRRHTLDLRMAQASPGPVTVFDPSQRVSQYRFGSTSSDSTVRQLQFNPPNLRMFQLGTVPFFGDYIDISPQYPFLGSIFNNLPFPAPVFHAMWTDNRDVRPPLDGNWQNYTPVGLNGQSKFDPTRTVPPCAVGQTGMRNQNVYTARISSGLIVGSPGNDKPLGKIQRAFVVTVQNAKNTAQSYRLQIVNQPLGGGKATFQQLPANAPALTTLDVTVNAKSSTSRSVFVTSNFKDSPVAVLVSEIAAVGGAPVPGGLTGATVLNPDPSSPDIGNPDIGNPDIGNAEVYNPDIGNAAVANPDIGNPDIGNPDIGNPDIGNPDIGNPDIGNPDIGNPDIGNPDIGNPDIGNPDIGNADIANGSVTDTTWEADNEGNTAASYTVKLLQTAPIPPGLKLQLILHLTYKTPVARNCVLGTERHEILIANVPRPTLSTINNVANPDIGNPSVPTLAIPNGGSAKITVRVVDPFHKGLTIPATTFLTPVVVAHAVNTLDLGSPNPQPPISLVITTPSLPDGVTGSSYSATMQAFGGKQPYIWSVPPLGEFGNQLPAGLSINASTGVISGAPSSAGTYSFTVRVTDSSTSPRLEQRAYTIRVANPLTFTTNSAPSATAGSPYNFTLTSSGGLAPIHWTVFSGALPGGLTLSDGGTISGTPTAPGTFNFQLRLTDSSQPPQTVTTSTFTLNVASPAQTYTVQGRFRYNREPRTPTAVPRFFLRNEDTGQQHNATITYQGGDTFTISGLPEGNFGVEATSDENLANGVNFPGDFYSFTTFNSVVASDGGFDVVLTRLIHLTLPHDNGTAFNAAFGCPPTVSAVAPTQISWNAIDVPANYVYQISRVTCPIDNWVTVVSGSTTGTSATFDPLPPTGANEYYLLTLYAYSGQELIVGQIITQGTNWHAWDHRFVVVRP